MSLGVGPPCPSTLPLPTPGFSAGPSWTDPSSGPRLNPLFGARRALSFDVPVPCRVRLHDSCQSPSLLAVSSGCALHAPRHKVPPDLLRATDGGSECQFLPGYQPTHPDDAHVRLHSGRVFCRSCFTSRNSRKVFRSLSLRCPFLFRKGGRPGFAGLQVCLCHSTPGGECGACLGRPIPRIRFQLSCDPSRPLRTLFRDGGSDGVLFH